MFVIDNRQANRDWDGTLEQLKGIVGKHGGELVRTDKWGERKLAYEISGRRRGTYVLTYFNADGDAVGRIYRDCELSDLVLRTLILQVKAVPSEEELRRFAEAGSGRRPVRRRDSRETERRPSGRGRRAPEGKPREGAAAPAGDAAEGAESPREEKKDTAPPQEAAAPEEETAAPEEAATPESEPAAKKPPEE